MTTTYRIRQYYDNESKVYLKNRPFMESYVIPRVIKSVSNVMMIERKFEWNTLVVGTGPAWLEGAFPNISFVSIDISPEMARLAGESYKNVTPIVASGEYLPFRDKSFSAMITARAIKFMDIPALINEAKRGLIECGVLLVIYDCGDARWVKLLENLGISIDVGLRRKTLRSPELLNALDKAGFDVQWRGVITAMPPSILGRLSGLMLRMIGILDSGMREGRISVVLGSRRRQVISS